jgi:hypothetical protein
MSNTDEREGILKKLTILKTNDMNQFKRAQVVILPTKFSKIYKEDDDKLYQDEVLRSYGGVDHFHLYIISDDEIKDGDWCYNFTLKTVEKALSDRKTTNTFKKIIATTDISLSPQAWIGSIGYLSLPQPSQQFIDKYIESYNKGEVITDVLVEYERVFEIISKGQIGHPEDDISWWNEKLKVNPKDNTITIKKLKNNWNREEINNLLLKLTKHIFNKY